MNINLKMIHAILTALKKGDVAHKTDLIMKTSVIYGKCIGLNTLNPYYKHLEDKEMIKKDDVGLCLTEKGKALLKHLEKLNEMLGFDEDVEE